MKTALTVFLFVAMARGAVGGEQWRTFTDKTGRTLEARVLKVEESRVLVRLKSNGRETVIAFDQLSGPDVESLRSGAASGAVVAKQDKAEEDEPPVGRLYPRSKREIRASIRDILNRPNPPRISKDVHEATQLLNVFRYLSGLHHDVEPDSGFSENATKAALACEKEGMLSHDIGSYTDKCNLYTGKELAGSVGAYMEDAGPNNREKRGHRAWCLNPPMKKVGFGAGKNAYSAMWCMNADGKTSRGVWSYPGQGLYPIEYMLGDAWSLYGIDVPDALDKLEVRVFRLNARPDKPIPAGADIPGREIRIRFLSKALLNGINFELEEAVERGPYWVMVKGPGIRESYVVEFF